MSQASKDSKARIMQAFGQILAERQPLDAKIATKEEEAEQAQNTEILARALQYTADNIVRGLADLQLEFGETVGGMVTCLEGETEKLDELQRAIATETDRLDTLRKVRTVADALHLLTQEHQEHLRQLESAFSQDGQALEKARAEVHQQWEREQVEHRVQQEERQSLQQQLRATQEADYGYETARSRQIALDNYETMQRQRLRQLEEHRQSLERDWTEREQEWTRQEALRLDYQQRAEAFPEELEAAIREAREEAIREVSQEARIKVELATKDYESAQQRHGFQIESLEAKIAQQSAQIEDLSQQLQQAMQQSQALALRAFESSAERLNR